MDGGRSVRAAGTDGTDFEHRQKIDDRFQKLASAKSFISTTGTITIFTGIYTFIGSFIDSNIIGLDYGIVFPIIIALTSMSIWGLSTKVSSSVVDTGIVALHKLLSNLMLLISFMVLASISFELLFKQNLSAYILYPTIIIYLFTALISRRSVQADAEIIDSLETKKGGQNKKKNLFFFL